MDWKPSPPLLEVVVAAFGEPLGWIKKIPSHVSVTVYQKNPGAAKPARKHGTLQVLSLPNIGREAHTYLHHLLSNRDHLAPYTLFCQGKPFDHAPDLHGSIRSFPSPNTPGAELQPPFKWLGFLIDTDDKHGALLFRNWSKNPSKAPLPLGEFYERLFGQPSPHEYTFYGGAQFILSRELALSRHPKFVRRAFDLVQEYGDLGAHCMERIWDKFFGVDGVDPNLLGGHKTAYLKPIARLRGMRGAGKGKE